jgi:hypothetical protein
MINMLVRPGERTDPAPLLSKVVLLPGLMPPLPNVGVNPPVPVVVPVVGVVEGVVVPVVGVVEGVVPVVGVPVVGVPVGVPVVGVLLLPLEGNTQLEFWAVLRK